MFFVISYFDPCYEFKGNTEKYCNAVIKVLASSQCLFSFVVEKGENQNLLLSVAKYISGCLLERPPQERTGIFYLLPHMNAFNVTTNFLQPIPFVVWQISTVWDWTPLGQSRLPVFSCTLSPFENKLPLYNELRQLHQRKQNYEIYKYLKFELEKTTREVKRLREEEKQVRMNKGEVSNPTSCRACSTLTRFKHPCSSLSLLSTYRFARQPQHLNLSLRPYEFQTRWFSTFQKLRFS